MFTIDVVQDEQGVTKRCRLSWLANSAFVYDPKWGGGGEVCGVSVQLCTWSLNKFWRPAIDK
jgi:hypothetical protein